MEEHPGGEGRGPSFAWGAFWGCFAGVIVLGVLVITLGYFSCKGLIGAGISSDFTDYINVVRQSDIDPVAKEDLLDRLTSIRDRARGGDRLTLWAWLDHDEAIRGLTGDGVLGEDEVDMLRREMDSLEKALEEKE